MCVCTPFSGIANLNAIGAFLLLKFAFASLIQLVILIKLYFYLSFCSYGDALMEIDSGVGLILSKLKELGLDNNTFALFSSDNGAATYAFTDGKDILFREC